MLRLAVVGATGLVGRECLRLLDQGSGPPTERVVAVASPVSSGRDLRDELGLSIAVDPVVTLDQLDPGSVDVAILSCGAPLSRLHAERLAAAGVLVVDNSSAFRMRGDVPLVVPQVNPESLDRRPRPGIVANPNCSTIQLVRALHPLQLAAGVDRVVVATYQAASGGGEVGRAELAATSAALLAGTPPGPERTGRFGPALAFDLVPHIGPIDEAGLSHEERKLSREPRKILQLPDLAVTATAVRVPVFDCHAEAVHVRLRRPLSIRHVEDALAGAPGLRVHRPDASPPYPTPRFVAASDERRAEVHVGRIRIDPHDPHAVLMWVVADNLRVGAALNALQIVELAVKYGWLG